MGRFELIREIGRGGFGVVFEARDTQLSRSVAFKAVRAGRRSTQSEEWLLREAEAAARLSHPNIVQLYDFGRCEFGPYLILELLNGETLARSLGRGAPAERDAIRVILEVAEAVAHAHDHGVVHRDIKPSNVFLTDAGHVKVLDFGLAHLLGRGWLGGGTPGYMAPEQARGEVGDERADVFALGVLLFELLTGSRPFEVRGDVTSYSAAPPVDRVPGSFASLLGQALAWDPSLRPRNARAVLDRLAAIREARARTGASRVVRRRVGAVFFVSSSPPAAIKSVMGQIKGHLAHMADGRHVIAFDPSDAENPVRTAVRAARLVVAAGVAPRALVDLATATVVQREGSGQRYSAEAFGDPDSYPRDGDPLGVSVTEQAAEVIPGAALAPEPERNGIRVLATSDTSQEPLVDATISSGRAAVPLIGRDDVLGQLLQAAEVCFTGASPSLAAVIAEAGLGKSHLARALAERLRCLGAAPRVLEIRARDQLASGETMRALVRALDRAAPGEPIPGRERRDDLSGVALSVGELSPRDPALSSHAAAPGALRTMSVRAVGSLLRRHAASRPLCLLIDDAHLAGGAALDAIEYAGLAEAGVPFFACAFARPAFALSRSSWGERSSRSISLRLGPLSLEAAASLCRALLQPAEFIPARAVELLAARAGGVPFLLVELVRGLERQELVRRRPGADAHYVATDLLERTPALPLVEWLADRELDALPPGLMQFAQLLALLGDEFDPDEAAGVMGELEGAGLPLAVSVDVASASEQLVDFGVLVARAGGGTGFRAPLIREALARSAAEGLRRAIHEAAFRLHSLPTGMPDSRRLARLARHATAVGRREEAGQAHLLMAQDLRERHLYLDAEVHYTRALEQLPAERARDRMEALRGRGLMRLRAGQSDKAVFDLSAAADLARQMGDREAEAVCMLDEATALDFMGDFGGARRLWQEAADRFTEASPRLRARLELARGLSLFRFSNWAEAAGALERAVALASETPNAEYETLLVALLMLGSALPLLARSEDADRALARAGQLASEHGDHLHLCSVLINRRNLLVARGQLEEAVSDQLNAAQMARELGMAVVEYRAEYNVAELRYQAADYGEVEPHLSRAADIEARHPDAAPVPYARLLAARIALATGDLEGSRRCLASFRENLSRASSLGWHGAELGAWDGVLVDMVDLATRDAAELEWEALADRSRQHSVEQDPIEVLEMWGRTAARTGRTAEARRALAGALELAKRIPNLLAPRIHRALADLERERR